MCDTCHRVYQTVSPMQFEYNVSMFRGSDGQIDYCNLLRDLDRGDFDYMTYDEIKEKYPDEFKRKQENALMYRYPGICIVRM